MASPQTALVTGANRGIGLEFVKQLAECPGMKYIFAAARNANSAEDLQQLQKTHKNIHLIALDVQSDQSIENAFNEVKAKLDGENLGLNLLINNAGYMSTCAFGTTTREELQKHFDINTAGPFMVTKIFSPLLQKAASLVKSDKMGISRAIVITISSMLGSITDNTSGSGQSGIPYRASKAAVNMIMKSMAIDLKPDGILCVSFCPGWVATDMGGQRASLTSQQSVSEILATAKTLTYENVGQFLRRDGNVYQF